MFVILKKNKFEHGLNLEHLVALDRPTFMEEHKKQCVKYTNISWNVNDFFQNDIQSK